MRTASMNWLFPKLLFVGFICIFELHKSITCAALYHTAGTEIEKALIAFSEVDNQRLIFLSHRSRKLRYISDNLAYALDLIPFSSLLSAMHLQLSVLIDNCLIDNKIDYTSPARQRMANSMLPQHLVINSALRYITVFTKVTTVLCKQHTRPDRLVILSKKSVVASWLFPFSNNQRNALKIWATFYLLNVFVTDLVRKPYLNCFPYLSLSVILFCTLLWLYFNCFKIISQFNYFVLNVF